MQLRLIFPRLLRWRSGLDCEMLSSPDILPVLLAGIAWTIASKYTVLVLFDLDDRGNSYTQVKFYESSGYCAVLNFAFIFHGFMVQFQLVRFLN